MLLSELKEMTNRKIVKLERNLSKSLSYENALIIKSQLEIYFKFQKWLEEIK